MESSEDLFCSSRYFGPYHPPSLPELSSSCGFRPVISFGVLFRLPSIAILPGLFGFWATKRTCGLDHKMVRVGPACRAGLGIIQDAARCLELQTGTCLPAAGPAYDQGLTYWPDIKGSAGARQVRMFFLFSSEAAALECYLTCFRR